MSGRPRPPAPRRHPGVQRAAGANSPSGSTSARSASSRAATSGPNPRRTRSEATGSVPPAKLGNAPPVAHGAIRATTVSTAPAAASATGGADTPIASRENAASRPAEASGTAGGRAIAPPSSRNSATMIGSPAAGEVTSQNASTAAAGSSPRRIPRSTEGRGSVGSAWIAASAGYGSGPTPSSSGVAAARSGATSRSPSAGSPTWATRTCTTGRPRIGSGSAGTGGRFTRATDVVTESGSPAVHSRHRCSTVCATSAANHRPPA